MKYSFSSANTTLLPPYSGSKTVSPSFTKHGLTVPLSRFLPGPTAMTLPKFNYSLLFSGNKIPPLVLVMGAVFSMMTLFMRGLSFLKASMLIFLINYFKNYY